MTKSFDYRHIVTLEETNLVGNVYFSNYLRWQGHCRERFLIEYAPSVLRALTTGLALVTVSCQCDFFEELTAADTIEIRMSLGRVDGSRIYMTFCYYRVDGTTFQLVARGSQTIACMRRIGSGMESIPVPEELATALKAFVEPDVMANGNRIGVDVI
jgi:enediyne core biosynthesis thioesterase